MQKKTDRRTFLAAAGATATTVALAGCSGGDDNGDDGDDGDNGDNGDSGPSVPDAVDSYLSDNSANGYSGPSDAVDETGSGSVTIDVGAGDGLSFGPAAVVVDAGTEITWEWTGNGGPHNVVSADSSDNEFNSGEAVPTEGETFTQTFDSASNNMYYCDPHSSVGMHGAVIVVE